MSPAGDGRVLPELFVTGAGTLPAGTSVLGLYDITVDGDAGTVALEPVRGLVALGDAYLLDLTRAFSTPQFGCSQCLQGESVTRESGPEDLTVTVTFRARHPFATPTPEGRKDLHINNARLVWLADGTDTFYGGSEPQVRGEVRILANADGYTALDPAFVSLSGGDSNLFPFRIFETGDNLSAPAGNFDPGNGWSSVLTSPTGYNVLPMGGSATTGLAFRLNPGESAALGGRLALLGNYIVSAASRQDRPNPTYLMPEGAMKEAWRVTALAPTDLLDAAGEQLTTLSVEVCDWQHGLSADLDFPNAANPMGLLDVSDVTSVQVAIPGWGQVFGPVTVPLSGSGVPADPLQYQIPITKPAGTLAGTYWGLVKVTDSRLAQTALKADLATPVVLTALATYQAVAIPVAGVPNLPPVCGGYLVNPDPPTGILSGSSVDLFFEFDNDPDGTIALVEVDWDYDGLVFAPDASRTTSGVLSEVFTADGTIAIRFTDDDGASNDPALCTIAVTVIEPPTGFFGPVNPLPPSGFYGGGLQSRFEAINNRPPLATYGDNVYIVLRDGQAGANGTQHVYVARSADGGATWGTPLQATPSASGGTNWLYNSIATTASGKVLLFGLDLGSPYIYRLSRLAPSGTNDVVFDSYIGQTVTPFVNVSHHFDPCVTTDPTDPNIAYLTGSDDSTISSAQGSVRLVRVNNVESSPSFSNLGFYRALTFTVISDSMSATDSNGDVHLVVREGTTLYYREWLKSTGNWRAAAETIPLGTTAGLLNHYLAVSHFDNLPIVSYDSTHTGSGDAYMIKATNSTAPTFASSTPVLVQDDPTGIQARAVIATDDRNGAIYVTYGDIRDAVESNSSRRAGFLSRFDAALTRTHPDLKIDMPGLDDNSDGSGDFVPIITNRGTPAAMYLLVFWKDGDTPSPDPDVLYRRAGL